MKKYIVKLDAKDTVGVAIKNLSSNEQYTIIGTNDSILACEDVIFGHKVALVDLKKGDNIIKYGEVIATAKIFIKSGRHVHIHNMKNTLG